MRASDKKKNMKKANLMAETRYLKTKGLIKEGEYEDFENREAYVDATGDLRSFTSPNTEAAGKLAYEELKSIGVPVAENRWHNSDGTILFIIDAEMEGSEKWVNPYYGSDISKMEKWKNPKISNTVTEILSKYGLYSEWEDNATVNIRKI